MKLVVKEILHERGADKKLVPLEVELETLREVKITGKAPDLKEEIIHGPTVMVIPMTRGQLATFRAESKKIKDGDDSIISSKSQDDELIKNHLIQPALSDEEIKDVKPKFATAITYAILSVSLGMSQTKLEEAGKKALDKEIERVEKETKN